MHKTLSDSPLVPTKIVILIPILILILIRIRAYARVHGPLVPRSCQCVRPRLASVGVAPGPQLNIAMFVFTWLVMQTFAFLAHAQLVVLPFHLRTLHCTFEHVTMTESSFIMFILSPSSLHFTSRSFRALEAPRARLNGV